VPHRSAHTPASGSDVVDDLPKYCSLEEATAEDMKRSVEHFNKVSSPDMQANRILRLMKELKGVNLGCQVDLYEHGLQTATRAHRDGADEETVVVGLLHDIGEVLSPIAHGEVAASLLRPYISPENYWILMHHEIFQGYYYGDAAGIDKNLRDKFRDSEHFVACESFCRDWDQTSFDPTYESLPMDFFVPMVKRVIARTPYWHASHSDDAVCAAKSGLQGAYPK